MTYQNNQNIAAIRPEIVAGKLAAIANLQYPTIFEQLQDQPRLRELLWFIQWSSGQPGGLKKFSADFLDRFADRIGTKAMHDLGVITRGSCKPGELADIRRQFHGRTIRKFDEDAIWEPTLEMLLAKCRSAATNDLPGFLAALCNEVSQDFSARWYFRDLFSALFEWMDAHAALARQRLAMTEVAVKIFDALDYAWSERGMVQIEGDSRFGKSEAIQTWCAMRPGLARLVVVPYSNSESDLFKAIAEAIGIDASAKGGPLRERIEYVLKHGKIMLVFDEGHFLIPTRFSKNTPPMRLNWIRTGIVDKRLPTALCFTPQSYKHALNSYLKKTGYTIEQFIGRTLLKIELPKELCKKDLLAVAKIHFPELNGDFLELVAAKARQSESYLMAMEAVSRRARYLAKRNGRDKITLPDLDQAILEALPCASNQAIQALPVIAKRATKATAFNPVAEELQNPCKRVAQPMTAAPGQRSLTPVAEDLIHS